MSVAVFSIMTSLAMGALLLGFDRQIARFMTWESGELGKLFRKHRIWGTLANPPDPETSCKNILFFIRFCGASITFMGTALAVSFLLRR